jgi:hypothetical protein
MQYIQPTSGAEQNFGFGDLSYAELHLTGTMSGGSAGPAHSTPLALVPNIGPIASASSPFPWWLVIIAIGLVFLLSDR